MRGNASEDFYWDIHHVMNILQWMDTISWQRFHCCIQRNCGRKRLHEGGRTLGENVLVDLESHWENLAMFPCMGYNDIHMLDVTHILLNFAAERQE